jgi:hypothetical protein
VDEGTVPVVYEGGGGVTDFELLLEQAGNKITDSRKTSSSRDFAFTNLEYQFVTKHLEPQATPHLFRKTFSSSHNKH